MIQEERHKNKRYYQSKDKDIALQNRKLLIDDNVQQCIFNQFYLPLKTVQTEGVKNKFNTLDEDIHKYDQQLKVVKTNQQNNLSKFMNTSDIIQFGEQIQYRQSTKIQRKSHKQIKKQPNQKPLKIKQNEDSYVIFCDKKDLKSSNTFNFNAMFHQVKRQNTTMLFLKQVNQQMKYLEKLIQISKQMRHQFE